MLLRTPPLKFSTIVNTSTRRCTLIRRNPLIVLNNNNNNNSAASHHISACKYSLYQRQFSSDDNDDDVTTLAPKYRLLHSEQSEYNNKVVVSETHDGKFRNLSFGGTPATSLLQGTVGLKSNDSFDFRSRCGYIDTMASAAIAFLKVLQHSNLNHFYKDYSHLLFIGLGAGSLPNFFVRHFPTMDVEVVEIDPAVANVSVEYFGLPARKLKLFVKDERSYLENDAKNSSGKNIIFLDIFNEDGLPRGVFNQAFFQRLHNLLRSQGGGLLIANVFCDIKTFNQILTMWKSVFKTVHLLAVEENGNNIIMVAYDSDAIPIEKVIDTAAQIADHHEFDYDLLKVLQYGIAEGEYNP